MKSRPTFSISAGCRRFHGLRREPRDSPSRWRDSIKRRRPDVRVVFGGPSQASGAAQILEASPSWTRASSAKPKRPEPAFSASCWTARSLQDAPPGLVVRRDGAVVTPRPAAPGRHHRFHAARPIGPGRGALSLPHGHARGRPRRHPDRARVHSSLSVLRLRRPGKKETPPAFDRARLGRTGVHRRTSEADRRALHRSASTTTPSRCCHRGPSPCAKPSSTGTLGLYFRASRAPMLSTRNCYGSCGTQGLSAWRSDSKAACRRCCARRGKSGHPTGPTSDLEPEREFVARVRDSVVTAKKYGFNVGVSIILGLPTETPADGEATLRFVKSLPIDFYMHNFLWVFPGTPLWETRDRYGIGCAINSMGLAVTTDYAYDVTKLRPRPNCSLEQDARVVKTLASGCAVWLRRLACS